MKIIIYNVVMSLCMFSSLYSMERGPITRSKSKRELVPEVLRSPRKRACSLLTKETLPVSKESSKPDVALPAVKRNQVYTPTSTKVRVHMVKSMADAIYGPDLPDSLVQNICKDSTLMCASPQSLAKKCHQKFKELIFKDLGDAGVSLRDMQKQLRDAAQGVQSSVDNYKHLQPASRRVRTLGKRLLSELPNPPFVSFRNATSAKEEEFASATGTLVLINEDAVGTTEISEEELLWLLAHEIQHIINKDQLEYFAYELAADKKDSKSDKLPDIQMRFSREQEVFADIGPALRNWLLAQGYVKKTENWCKEDPSFGGPTHPAYVERKGLAHASVAFLAQHEVEKKRLEAQPGYKPVKRDLMLEFD